MTEQDVERVARAINPFAFESWQSSYDYEMKQSGDHNKATEFADWCNKGAHPANRLDHVREQAKAAIAAMPSKPLKDDLEPKEGALALCSLGYLGLIERQSDDGRWCGKSMYDHTKPWSSSKPRVLGYMPNKHEKALAVAREALEHYAKADNGVYQMMAGFKAKVTDKFPNSIANKALATIDEVVGKS